MSNTSLSVYLSANSSSTQAGDPDVVQFLAQENRDCYNKDVDEIPTEQATSIDPELRQAEVGGLEPNH
ncbi:hypothetical protein V6N13_041635 [Hibiscus sabdariffa]